MNRRIKKKVEKRQLIMAVQGLVEWAQEQQRWEEERTKRIVAAYEQYYRNRANAQ